MAIKDVLREELQNSEQMLSSYLEELEKLPRGSLIKKKVKGHEYYYIVYRLKGKVQQDYMGKEVSKEMIEKYKRAKMLRAKYRNNISKLKKQIKFLKGAIRGKEPI